jgi:hypothetical protein
MGPLAILESCRSSETPSDLTTWLHTVVELSIKFYLNPARSSTVDDFVAALPSRNSHTPPPDEDRVNGLPIGQMSGRSYTEIQQVKDIWLLTECTVDLPMCILPR